jgi:hypothetical protein
VAPARDSTSSLVVSLPIETISEVMKLVARVGPATQNRLRTSTLSADTVEPRNWRLDLNF